MGGRCGWRQRLALAAAGVVIGSTAPAPRAAAEEAHRVLGTVRVQGEVESALSPGGWQPFSGGPLLEGMRIRTGARGAAVLELASGDLLGLGEGCTCELGTGRPLAVRLKAGRLAVRLRPGAALIVETPGGVVRPPAATLSTGSRFQEAMVTVSRGTTILHTYQGTFELVGPGGAVSTVDAGHEASLEPGATTARLTPVAATTADAPAGEANRKRRTGAGILGAFGLSPLTAALVGGGVVVAGGAVGGAAAGGAFSSHGSAAASASGQQGSPFRPVRR